MEIIEFESIEKIAKQNLERDGHCTPVAILFKEKQNKKSDVHICQLVFETRKEKESIKKQVREKVKQLDIDRYWIVMEAWISTNLHVDFASRDINRKEALVITEFEKGNPQENTIVLFFKRENNKIIWEEKKESKKMKDTKNSWNFYMEEISIDDMKEKHRREDISKRIKDANFKGMFEEYKEYLESKGENAPFTYEEFKAQLLTLVEKGNIGFVNGIIPDIFKNEKEKKNEM